MTWRTDRLPEITRTMATRPRHEALRVLITEILHSAFDAPYTDLQHEAFLVDRSGRIDTLWGAIVIEFKSDLRRELRDVEARMPDYLAEAASRSAANRPVTGIATDGATFIAYQMQGATLQELQRYQTDPNRPTELLAWLELQLSETPDLRPEARAIAQAFGRGSLTFARARLALQRLWAALQTDPETRLKRDLWDGLLAQAYGESVGTDPLFLQHTYLTIVVKAIAARVLDLPVTDAARLLRGQALTDAGIHGAVEADFFDWLLRLPEGATLVRDLAAEVSRFTLHAVETDVLKVLYESLVDPDERHDLGEYYTPDWLAFRLTAAAIPRPLEQRVLDPACGSGTFLFHALRRLITAGQAAGWSDGDILRTCADKVRGLDIHPVAVTLARVTWLLALGPLIAQRASRLDVPVFLGDALQWGLRRYPGGADVLVEVPGGPPLQVPAGLAAEQAVFEQALDALNQGLQDRADRPAMARRLARIPGASPADADALADSYVYLRQLYDAGRNGIWTFVLRNLVRPVWLSRPDQRADVLIGNPPWIVYRHLSAALKDRVQSALRDYGLWVGGNLATQQDVCALFWARGAEYYLAPGGSLAFVLPFAVLNAPVYAALRAGRMGAVSTAITGGWSLERVWPIFGAQSGSSTTSTCALFATLGQPAGIPAEIDRFVGHLARRDATEEQAQRALTHTRTPWPRPRTLVGASPYRKRFKDGASIFPRRFFIVDPEPAGRLGARRDAPLMRGRAGPLDKKPWTEVEPPRGPVESRFLRPLALGESVAPFRMLNCVTAVIPLEANRVLNAATAREASYPMLAAWLDDVEAKWRQHSVKKANGEPVMTLTNRINHMRLLSVQAVTSPWRVLYGKAGTRLSAALLRDQELVVDHKAYWASTRSLAEAHYLLAVINSGAVLAKITDLQPHGQRDKRDFDNLVWTLSIPEYNDTETLHRDLAAAGARAEAVAALVPLTDTQHFTAKRRAIRTALVEDGIAAEIEALVDALLPT